MIKRKLKVCNTIGTSILLDPCDAVVLADKIITNTLQNRDTMIDFTGYEIVSKVFLYNIIGRLLSLFNSDFISDKVYFSGVEKDFMDIMKDATKLWLGQCGGSFSEETAKANDSIEILIKD